MSTADSLTPGASFIHIDIGSQTLRLTEDGQVSREYPVSTGANGYGCEAGSYRTHIAELFARVSAGMGVFIEAGTSCKDGIPDQVRDDR